MIMLKTPILKNAASRLNLALVDESKTLVIDTMYGTYKATYDSCLFLKFDDFTKYRTQRIALHPWYQYDTFYHFAAVFYIVKYNYCKFRDQKLYVRYTEPYSGSQIYHYIEVPDSIRIHLHNYSNQLYDRATSEIRRELKNSILAVSCKNWGLRDADCKQ